MNKIVAPELKIIGHEQEEPYLDEADFQQIIPEISGYTLVTQDRCFALFQLAGYARSKQGDVAEIGVYKGGTARLIAKICPNKKIHLFDTFAGLPKEDPNIDLHHQGDFSDVNIQSVQEFLGDCGNIEYHPGFFPETAKGIEEKFCFVHIDVDLYPSVKDSLEYFYPKMVPGGVMVFDDYEWEACPGVKKAIDEFLVDKPEIPVITAKYQCALIKSENTIVHLINKIRQKTMVS